MSLDSGNGSSGELLSGEIFSHDEHVRRNISLEKLAELPAAFRRKGTVTAGNASLPCDGAGVVLVASAKSVETEKWNPLARIVGYVSMMTEPQDTFAAGIPAIEKCLAACRLSISDIDLFEISESFAAQAILTRDKLAIPSEKINIHGGDLALGHPLGFAGARILITLLHALKNHNQKRGLACICFGGGGAIAMVVENE